jgi:hypothetical protein
LVAPNTDTLPELLDGAGCQFMPLEEALKEDNDRLISILVARKEFKICEELCRNKYLDFCGALI